MFILEWSQILSSLLLGILFEIYNSTILVVIDVWLQNVLFVEIGVEGVLNAMGSLTLHTRIISWLQLFIVFQDLFSSRENCLDIRQNPVIHVLLPRIIHTSLERVIIEPVRIISLEWLIQSLLTESCLAQCRNSRISERRLRFLQLGPAISDILDGISERRSHLMTSCNTTSATIGVDT